MIGMITVLFSCRSKNITAGQYTKACYSFTKPSSSSIAWSDMAGSNSETYAGSVEDNEANAAIKNAAAALNVTRETHVRAAAPSIKERMVVKLMSKNIDKLTNAKASSKVAKGGLKERMKVGLFSAALGLLFVILGVLFSKVILIVGLLVLAFGVWLVVREIFDK